MNVVHFITRLIIGGAQENTLLSVEDQHRDYGDKVTLVSGPGVGPEGSLEQRAREGGYDFRIIEQLGRAIRPWNDWRSYREFLRILHQIQPDIVHTHSSKAGILGRAAAARLRIPCVHTIHGASFHRGQNLLASRLYRTAEKWAAKRCDHLISVCNAMTDQYVSAGIAAREKFTTIYSGMDVESLQAALQTREHVRSQLGFDGDHIVIAKVARLFDLKGHEYVIDAARTVVAEFPSVRFLLVGDGTLKSRCERQIAELGLSRYFVFTGLVTPDRVPALVHASDIVVHTSLWEGLARVLPQALIAGKPVVSFDIDGAREVVIPRETGYLIPAADTARLAKALNELVGNAELRQRLGDTGRKRFTDQFRHEIMTRRIREVYQALLQ